MPSGLIGRILNFYNREFETAQIFQVLQAAAGRELAEPDLQGSVAVQLSTLYKPYNLKQFLTRLPFHRDTPPGGATAAA